MNWFERLGYGPQINEVVVNFFYECVAWIQSLSLNQRLVFAALVIAALFVVNYLFKVAFRVFVTIRRWLRRKSIPVQVDLHLDRD